MSTDVTEFPTLYKRASTGKFQSWAIWVVDDSIHTAWGQVGGKTQKTVDVIRAGKNVGKRNETTPTAQAEAEALAQWEAKLKKGYVQSLDAARAGKVDERIEGGISPMLAHRYDQHAHKIVWPAYVQPKLDGHRCIAIVENGECTLWSRTRKRITGVPHIVGAIEQLCKRADVQNWALDGELYNHDYRNKFEELSSLIRQQVPKAGHEIVQYHVYDRPDATLTFRQRLTQLDAFIAGQPSVLDARRYVRQVQTIQANDEQELSDAFERFVRAGYEGAMVRNSKSAYVNKRSYDLQKLKEFEDSEFLIVAVEEGRGKLAGHAIFVCAADNGKQFRAKLKGEQAALRLYWEQPELCVGQQLTVKYQGRTADGLPRFPVGVHIRDDGET